jgi:hypothetical protein
MDHQISTSDNSEIFNPLWLNFKNSRPVRLFNTFKGVPISYDGTILMISQGYIALDVHPYQAACIALEKQTYLQSEYIPGTIRARKTVVNVKEREVILERLMMAETAIGKHLLLKVKPRDPIPMEIETNTLTKHTTLAEISPDGVGIFSLSAILDEKLPVHSGSQVLTRLQLPDVDAPLELPGRIVHLTHERDSYRLAVHTTPSTGDEKTLLTFISNRVNEIMQDLEATCQILAKKYV